MDIMDMDVVYGLIFAVEGIIFFAKWNYKELKDRGTGAAVAILLSVFMIFFCVAVMAHNIIGT